MSLNGNFAAGKPCGTVAVLWDKGTSGNEEYGHEHDHNVDHKWRDPVASSGDFRDVMSSSGSADDVESSKSNPGKGNQRQWHLNVGDRY